ncbi:ABC transporter substrate-binding protein [Halobaculum sp. D14]|uniref:ABC transporter substrate-binding protein n=1 Tax=unclassified Halobaculum TaxID=2640896 RepID=UPI003EC0643B
MSEPDDSNEGVARREYLKYGAALVAGGGLAGCLGQSGSGTAPAGSTPGTATGAESATTTTGEAGETTAADTPYSVTIEPAGEVTFQSVPETWVAENASWADMGVALGLDKPSAVVLTSEYRTWHYADVPGLSASKDDMVSLWQDGIAKELFLEIDAGVHFIDPNYMVNLIPKWERADVEEMSDRVGPFCGNTSFSTYPWHENYPYFSLYEATEKVARVFRRMDRYRALVELHSQFLERIQQRLPPESERPAIALLSPGSTEPEQFYPYRLGETTAYKHWHDLGVADALDGTDIRSFTSNRGTIDYEALLEVDPEVLMFYTDKHWSRTEFRGQYLEFLRNHDTARELTAVQNGEVYPAGGMYQGPIINLSKTERAAKQLFSEEFGRDERLFDRQRIADIRNGDI